MRIIILLLIILANTSLAAGYADTNKYMLADKRQEYLAAQKALSAGKISLYRKHLGALKDYPLAAYLEYEELSQRLKTASDLEIASFIDQHQDLPQINWMRLRWLRWLAERGDWQKFLTYYQKDTNFAELDCLHSYYQLQFGDNKLGTEQAIKLWLTGKKAHSACDNTFKLLKQRGRLTEDLILQRVILALEAGQYQLAESISKNNVKLKKHADLAIKIYKNPKLVQNIHNFSSDKYMSKIAVFGLSQLARKDVESAYQLLSAYEAKFDFADDDKLKIARSIGLKMARNLQNEAYSVIARYDPFMKDIELTTWRLRLLLAKQDFSGVLMFILQTPEKIRNLPRFKYWYARSLQETGNKQPIAQSLLIALAAERGFYSFLAADILGREYVFHHKKAADVGVQVVQQVRRINAVNRALELFKLGDVNQARLEWNLLLNKLNDEQLAAAAKIAYNDNWYWAAIVASNKHRVGFNDLTKRFPVPYKEIVALRAKQYEVDKSWILAIMRQESLFMVNAKSPSGALGLMQVLPSTAQYVAKKYRLYYVRKQIFEPEMNITLGSAYLNQLHNQFGKNRILATAAYNAGPTRVRRWLADNSNLAVDIWIEIIPFNETRIYVQNVLAGAVIYSSHLGKKHKLIAEHEYDLTKNSSEQSAQ